jgi:hypothetical protein
MEEYSPELLPYLGTFAQADSNNLDSVVAQSTSSDLLILPFSVPSGNGHDIIDLAKLRGHKLISIESQTDEEPESRSVLSAIRHFRSAVNRTSRGVPFLMPLDDSKQGKKRHDGKRRVDATSPWIPIKSDAAAYNKIDYLMMRGYFDLRSELKVKKVFTGSTIGFQGGNNLKADSMFIRPATSEDLSQAVSWNNLVVVYTDVYSNHVTSTFVVGPEGWHIPSELGYPGEVEVFQVPKAKVSGRLTIILPHRPDSGSDIETALVGIDCETSTPFAAPDITFSMFRGVRDEFFQAQPKLVVTFSTQWDAYVTNTPTIVFEADVQEAIEFVNRPASNVKIETGTPNEDYLVPDTSANSGNGDNGGNDDNGGNGPDGLDSKGNGGGDDGGLGGAAIAGIVIGSIAVVGVAAFCAWFFVLRNGGDGPGLAEA